MNVFELSAMLILNKEAYDRGLQDAESSAKSSGIGDVFGKIGTAVKTGFLVAGAAAAKFGKDSIQTGLEFDTAMSQVAATMGKTSSEITDLREYAEEMGAKTAFSASEAAEGMNILAMAGLSANEIMEEGASGASALQTVLDLAAAGAMSMGDAASYVAGAFKGFGDEASNSAYYADLMAKGATMANTDVRGLGEALGDISATAKTYGQSAESATVSLLRLAEANVTGSAASTALAAAMKNLYTPSDQAKKALQELNVAAYENGKALDFNEVVNSLTDALAGYSDEEKNAYLQTIFGIQGLDAYNKMAAVSSQKQKNFWDGLSEASGSAAKQASEQLNNLQGDIILFESAFSGLQIALTSMTTGPLREFVQFFTDGLTQITDGLKEGGLTGAFRAFVQYFSQGFAQLWTWLQTAIPKFTQMGADILTTMASGLAESIPEFAAKALPMLLSFTENLRENFGVLVDAALNLILKLGEGIINSLPVLIAYVPQIVTNIVGLINDNAPKLILTGFKLLWQLITGIIQAIPDILANIGNILDMILALWSAFDWLNLGKSAITFIKNGIEGLKTKVPELLKKIGSDAMDWFKKIDWKSAGTTTITTITSGLSSLIGKIPETLKSIGSSAFKAFNDIKWIDLGKNIVNGIINGIKALAGTVVNAVKNLASDALDAAKDFLGIASPSKVFRDQVGKFIPAGIAVGIDRNGDVISDSLDALLGNAVDGASGVLGALDTANVYASSRSTAEGYEETRGLLEAILNELREQRREMPDNMADAVAKTKLEIGGREFGRVVRAYV